MFALGGKINNTGLVEVPMGTTLREIIYEIGGGIPNGKKFKAVQTGGPSGGCIPAQHLDTPIDYDNLIAIGSMMGSGGMIVMDEDNCMVDIAQLLPGLHRGRELRQMHPLPHRHPAYAGNSEAHRRRQGRRWRILSKLEELAQVHQGQLLCAVWARRRPTPCCPPCAISATSMRRILRKSAARRGVCKTLLNYVIDPDKCTRLYALRDASARRARSTGEVRKQHHVIDTSKCIKCGACMEKCKLRRDLQELIVKEEEQMEELIQLKIDGVPVEVPAGTTVLEAAKKAGINIPTLCYLKDVNEIGACRMCVVEVTGARSPA